MLDCHKKENEHTFYAFYEYLIKKFPIFSRMFSQRKKKVTNTTEKRILFKLLI